MGWTPVNTVTITREFNPTRQIVVTWIDDITGKQVKHFTFEQSKEAFEFAAKEFSSLAM